MPSLADVVEVLRRLFMAKVHVRRLDCGVERTLAVRGALRRVVVHAFMGGGRSPEIRGIVSSIPHCRGGTLLSATEIALGRWTSIVAMEANVGGGRILPLRSNVIGERCRPLVPVLRSMSIVVRRETVRKDLRRMLSLPQRRRNRLAYLKKRPTIEGGSLLALFSPVVRKGVARSVLDKGSGDLLVWMDPRSSARDAYHLFLVRRFAETPPLSWVWLAPERGTPMAGGGSPTF